MTRTAKKWAGIAMVCIIIAPLLFQRQNDDRRMQGAWSQKYRRTRMQISWQLMNLRHEYSIRQLDVSQNTVLEIKELWHGRDVLFQVLHHRESPFQADSLIKLERMIDSRKPLMTVLREIERIEKINETSPSSTP